MVDFNPFDKPVAEIEFDDLNTLEKDGVSEGYYVEYKRQFPNQPEDTVAKIIASFANTYGGWLFLGVPEKFNNEAASPIGIHLTEHDGLKETVRRWVKTRVDPVPDFDIQLVRNPEYTDWGVLIIEVPESRVPPHIMNDGVIYRRNGEESDPIEPETDRWQLDRLYENRRERERKKQRVLQYLRALEKELDLNNKSAKGGRKLLRKLQQNHQVDSDHYVIDLLATDAWDAALDEQLIEIISQDVYQQLQEQYKLIRSTNELIRRLRTEVLHPEIGTEKSDDWGDFRIWTITVSFWNSEKEEMDYLGLGPLIMQKLSEVQKSTREISPELTSEIERLEEENTR
ncbi:AlbA family DNA-binding domain-containing protein [Halobellus inordinatus]|uniref:AlbA family DNA-binding domain-containing protein n=1 Tax=Halobellus inordinatus TaxID=1126236 RepID=UPI0021148F87|nr:ATP-binding protein [Halobellus ramosii]